MYTKAGTIFGVQTFEFQYFGGFSEKNIFWGMMKLWTFFLGHHNLFFFVFFCFFWGGWRGSFNYIYTF